ncbi:hypothetical protein K438DRAFT_1978148 [Mycena galopus ATCC 62051]|nr:hypothetical protein K438DRAFT_1978148 [Mycena galopus ATCC 62051]
MSDTQCVEETQGLTKRGISTDIRDTLDIGGFNVLDDKELLFHKIELAKNIQKTCESEARLFRLLASYADERVRREMEIHAVEAEVAEFKDMENRKRQEIFGRMAEVALQNRTNADMQSAFLRLEGRQEGLELEEDPRPRRKENVAPSSDPTISVVLD